MTEYSFKKNKFFVLNAIVFLIGAYLVSRLVLHRTETPLVTAFFYLSSEIYFFFWIALLAIYGIVVFKLEERQRAYLFAVVITLFALLEGAARLLAHPLSFGDALGYPQPYVMSAGLPNSTWYIGITRRGSSGPAEKGVRFNEFGVRVEKLLTTNKPQGEYRVFMLGGSTVMMGMPLESTLPGRLEEAWRQNGGKEVNVYNFGIVSNVSGQELALLTYRGLDYQPDLVIAYDGANDFQGAYHNDPRPGFPQSFSFYETAHAKKNNTVSVSQLLDSWLTKSQFIKIFFDRALQADFLDINGVRERVDYGTPRWEEAVAKAYTENHRKMCRISNAFGARYMGILQPLLYFKSVPTDKEKTFLGSSELQGYIARQFDRAREGFRELTAAEGAGCAFIDLSRIFERTEKTVYEDTAHVENSWNTFIAGEMYKQIKEFIPK